MPVIGASAVPRRAAANCLEPPSPPRSPVRLPTGWPARSAPADQNAGLRRANQPSRGSLGRHESLDRMQPRRIRATARHRQRSSLALRGGPEPIDAPDTSRMRDQAGSAARVNSISLASDARDCRGPVPGRRRVHRRSSALVNRETRSARAGDLVGPIVGRESRMDSEHMATAGAPQGHVSTREAGRRQSHVATAAPLFRRQPARELDCLEPVRLDADARSVAKAMASCSRVSERKRSSARRQSQHPRDHETAAVCRATREATRSA